jgi:hypothetical protein
MIGEREHVRLEIPSDRRFVAVTRLAVGRLGPVVGLDRVGVDDLRLAVSELCSSLVEASSDGRLEVGCDVGAGVVTITGRAPAESAAGIDRDRLVLSELILDATCDSHSLRVDSGTAEFRLVKRT